MWPTCSCDYRSPGSTELQEPRFRVLGVGVGFRIHDEYVEPAAMAIRSLNIGSFERNPESWNMDLG